jgi:hypothetical protein
LPGFSRADRARVLIDGGETNYRRAGFVRTGDGGDCLGCGDPFDVGLAALFNLQHQPLQAFGCRWRRRKWMGVAQQDVVIAPDVFDEDHRFATPSPARFDQLGIFCLSQFR